MVKAFELETTMLAKFDALMNQVYSESCNLARFNGVVQFSSELLMYGGVLLVACFGSAFLLSGTMSNGDLISFVLYLMIVVHAIGD